MQILLRTNFEKVSELIRNYACIDSVINYKGSWCKNNKVDITMANTNLVINLNNARRGDEIFSANLTLRYAVYAN